MSFGIQPPLLHYVQKTYVITPFKSLRFICSSIKLYIKTKCLRVNNEACKYNLVIYKFQEDQYKCLQQKLTFSGTGTCFTSAFCARAELNAIFTIFLNQCKKKANKIIYTITIHQIQNSSTYRQYRNAVVTHFCLEFYTDFRFLFSI